MKGMAAALTDTAVWTVADGKISHVKFRWSDAEGIDALFAPYCLSDEMRTRLVQAFRRFDGDGTGIIDAASLQVRRGVQSSVSRSGVRGRRLCEGLCPTHASVPEAAAGGGRVGPGLRAARRGV